MTGLTKGGINLCSGYVSGQELWGCRQTVTTGLENQGTSLEQESFILCLFFNEQQLPGIFHWLVDFLEKKASKSGVV